ncbi:hypothetical protein PENSPDRAFT_739987 [Peniophora sp. CONT]|nr:hypothetical protein PENSPDRAFT_739987 [Peniophora sp. CONT]
MGIVITCVTSLKTREGRRPLAQVVQSLAALPPDAAGLDTSVTYANGTLYFALPTREGGWSWWRVVKVLCKRETLRGRATRVYQLMREEDYNVEVLEERMKTLAVKESAESHSQRRPGVRSSPRQPQTTPAAPRGALNQAAFDRIAVTGEATLHELPRPSAEDCKHLELDAWPNWGLLGTQYSRLILKDACPLEERAKTETEFLTAVQDQHGFAPVLGAMTVQHGFADFVALEGLRRCGEVPEAYSGLDDGAELSMELRAQRRLLSTVEGQSLSEASALDVVYACVDCMIGASAF